MGIAIDVAGLTQSFGVQRIFEDVTLTLPAGSIVNPLEPAPGPREKLTLGPWGTGETVFLKRRRWSDCYGRKAAKSS